MSTFYGADVAELRALAARFGAAADRLASVSSEVSTSVGVAERWVGPDGEHFRSGWSSHGRVSVDGAEAALREASRRLLANAADQEGASAADGGAGPGFGGLPGGFPGGGGGGGGWGDLPNLSEPFWMQDLWGPAVMDPGEWSQLLDPVRIHDSIHAITGFLGSDTGVFGMSVQDFVSHLPLGGDIGQVFGIADIAFDPSRSVWDKGFELGSMVTHAAGGAMMEGVPGTPMWWGGLAVNTWTDVIDAARQADFSPGQLQDNFAYIAEDPARLVAPVAEAVVEVYGNVTDYVGVGWMGDMVAEAAQSADLSPDALRSTAEFAFSHPDAVVQSVGEAVGEVGDMIADKVVNEGGKMLVDGAIDLIKFW
ncbi:hypothetical protein [Demequina iriomotensis]|uniref:hypothetical protein n=1 Tax=Demequina iriomotensis TaxID=1536641 RepID=UPI00078141C3|nr:hypothetical protein [Demequina iriomotensis]